jgi:hypothetical protein
MRTRTRLVAAMATAILAAPFLSATAHASSTDHKCDQEMGVDGKCEKPKR